MLVYCHFTETQKPAAAKRAPSPALKAMSEQLSMSLPPKLQKGAVKAAALPHGAEEKLPHEIEAAMKKLTAQRSKAAAPPARPSCIFNRPAGVGIGFLPEDAGYTTLEGPTTIEKRKWFKIDFQGLVGWIGEA